MEYVWGITLVTRVRGFVKTSTETSRKGGPLNPTRTARRSARRLIFWNVVAWKMTYNFTVLVCFVATYGCHNAITTQE